MKTSMKTTRAHLSLESLEDRMTPAVGLTNGGDLVVQSTNGNDQITVGNGNPGYIFVRENGRVTQVARSRIWGGDVIVYGGAGNDAIHNWTNIRSWIYGQNGNDFIEGGSNADYIDGGNQNDTIHGNGGNDVLFGNYGDDILHGGAGNDRLYGYYGYDQAWDILDRNAVYNCEAGSVRR